MQLRDQNAKFSIVNSYSSIGGNPSAIINLRERLPAGRAYGPLWYNQEITDPSVFDYYHQSLEGPNRRDINSFRVLTLSLRQTFWNNRGGVELAYDRQKYNTTDLSYLENNHYRINIDFATTLGDGFSPNPNLGRPYTLSRENGNVRNNTREAFRATLFGELDFGRLFRGGNWLTRVMGRHIVTAVASDQKMYDFNRNFFLASYTLDKNIYGSAIATTYQTITDIRYLGPRIDGLASPTGAHIGGVRASQRPQASGDAFLFDQRTDARGVPFGWRTVPVSTLYWGDGVDNLYSNASKSRERAQSLSVVAQSYAFDGVIVGLLGWRDDKFKRFEAPPVPFASVNVAQPFDPRWQLNDTPAIDTRGRAFTWGAVAHSPRWLKKHYPKGMDVDVGYSESQNFRPSAVVTDEFGRAYDPPSGLTKDVSLTISALENRVVLRATSYKTTQSNDRYIVGGSQVRFYIAGWGRQLLNGLQQISNSEFLLNRWFGIDPNSPQALPNRASLSNPVLRLQPIPPVTPAELEFRRQWLAANSDAQWLARFDPRYPASHSYARGANGLTWNFATQPSIGQTTDSVAKGEEYEISFNLTRNWRLTANATHQEAVRSNTGGRLGEYIKANSSIWNDGNGVYATRVIDQDGLEDLNFGGSFNFGSSSVFYGPRTMIIAPYLSARAADGRSVPELKEWQFKVVTNYSFREGRLRGIGVGGAVRYLGRSAIGYAPAWSDAANLYFSDVTKPYWGPTELAFDFWTSYRRKLRKNIDWTVQFNIRDAFGKDTLIPIVAQPNGVLASGKIPSTNTWSITNTFSF